VTITVSAFIAASLDGFIATPDGGIAWLDEANAAVPTGEDCGYQAFMNTVDTLVVGSRTFQQVLTFDEWPYRNKRVIVLSQHGHNLPDTLPPDVSVSSEEPPALVDRLRSASVRHVYIDGGITIQRFLRADLVNTITITVIPVLLGAGKPLFGSLDSMVKLTHISTTTYSFGFVQSKYRVVSK
jgi:dihydrofolate reductase